jgi:FtsP/CotA-like multicopper oxidase with cupredoxin domain
MARKVHVVATVAAIAAVASSAVAEAHPGHAVGSSPTFTSASAMLAQVTPTPTPPFATGQPFREPPVVRSSGGRLKQTLVAANTAITVGGVQVDGAQTYRIGKTAGGLLGPTLQVQRGDLIDLTFDNRLTQPPLPAGQPAAMAHGDDCPHPSAGQPQPTNLHFHGLHVTPRNHTEGGVTYYGDNVFACLQAGISHIRFRIPDDHDLGTFWYHAHLHGLTDDQVFRGLAGMLLIGDSRTELPKRLRNVRTRLISLKDIQAVPDGAGWTVAPGHDWVDPTTRTVNGLVMPTLTIRPGETQLWRLANSSSGLWYDVALQDAANRSTPLTIVSREGNPLVRPQRVSDALLGPGQRVDVLVRAPAAGPLTLRTLAFAQGRRAGIFPQADLATVQVTGSSARKVASPGRGGKLPAFPPRVGKVKSWAFDIVSGPNNTTLFTINGVVFDPDKPGARTRLGTTERWKLVNQTGEWHPIHIHQDDYRVISVNGRRVDVRSDQDVVPLPPNGTVVLDMPFQQFSGNFVMHCHILDHEDGGMMTRIEVRK